MRGGADWGGYCGLWRVLAGWIVFYHLLPQKRKTKERTEGQDGETHFLFYCRCYSENAARKSKFSLSLSQLSTFSQALKLTFSFGLSCPSDWSEFKIRTNFLFFGLYFFGWSALHTYLLPKVNVLSFFFFFFWESQSYPSIACVCQFVC